MENIKRTTTKSGKTYKKRAFLLETKNGGGRGIDRGPLSLRV